MLSIYSQSHNKKLLLKPILQVIFESLYDFNMSFKKNTDDVRESVSIKIVKELLKKSMIVKVHDPMTLENFKNIFGDKIIYCTAIDDCIEDSTCCLILTEWDEYKKISQEQLKKLMKVPNLIDARRVLEPAKFRKINFQAIGLGNSLQ